MAGSIPVAASVANRIRDAILLEKRYPPNGKLPNEHDLARELGVSRTSIREAVKSLVAKGLLRIERGRGTFVAANPHPPEDPFGVSYLEDRKKLVVHWFEMRCITEPDIVRLACARGTGEDLAYILHCEREAAARIEQGRDFSLEDQKFHGAIAKAAHNTVIELMLPAMENAVADAVRTSVRAGYEARSRENALVNHRLIAGFIEQRDGDGAAMAMYCHIKRGMRDLR